MSRQSDESVKVGLTLIFIGAGFIYHGLRRMRQARAIEDTPCSDIRSAAQGLVEFQGHALPAAGPGYRTLEDDFCVYRDLKIEKYVKRGKNASWETIFREEEGSEFILSDGTGIARVHVASADLVLKEKVTTWRNFSPQLRERTSLRYAHRVPEIANQGGSVLGFLTRPTLRFTERVIRIAAPVYAKGYFQTVKMTPYTLSPQYYRFLGKLAELRKLPGWKKKAFDLDRDGKITEFEFEKGSEKLLYLAKGDIQAEDLPEPVAFQGLLRHAPEHGLMIGDSYQEILTERLRANSVLRVFGGILMVSAGMGILFGLFH